MFRGGADGFTIVLRFVRVRVPKLLIAAAQLMVGSPDVSRWKRLRRRSPTRKMTMEKMMPHMGVPWRRCAHFSIALCS